MKNRLKIMRVLLRNDAYRVSFMKYLGGAVGTVLVAFFVFGLLYYNLYSAYLRHTQSLYHERNLYRTSAAVSYLLDNVEQNYLLIAADDNLAVLLTTPERELPAFNQGSPSASGVSYTSIRQTIGGLFEKTVLSPAMDSIYVYSEVNGYIVTWTEFRTYDSFSDRGFLDAAAFSNGHGITAREKWTHTGVPNVITILREISHEGKRIGVIAFNLKYDVFAEYINRGAEALPQDLYVTDSAGNLFFSENIEALRAAPLAKEPYEKLAAEAMETGSSTLFEGGVVYAVSHAADGSHTVYGAMGSVGVIGFTRDFTRLALWSGIGGLAIAVVAAFLISFRLYRNILQLIAAIGEPYDKEHSDELKYIAASIAGLTARNSSIESELAEKLAELKKAQAIALQTQINPHFILNTLQIVNLEIMQQTGGDSPATRVVALLSDILKSNLNTTDYLVPLSYEIRQAMKYADIENLRGKNRLHMDFDIDEPLTEYRTVKFILQPVLENCIKHGFSGRDNENRRVTVCGRREGKRLVLTIRDNGNGIPPQALAELQERLRRSHIAESRHIGLCNVDKRIKLVFGSDCGVTVASEEKQGTVVTIRQRLVRKQWQ